MSNEPNVSEMPEDYWGWTGERLVPLGVCEDFDEAAERADSQPRKLVWLFSRECLTELGEQIKEELK